MNSFEIVEFNHCVKSNNCMTILVYNEIHSITVILKNLKNLTF